MKHHFLVIGLLWGLLTLSISAVQAQDTPQEGWPVEQRCVGEPTQPPKGWKWSGRIFVQGIEGIRVLDADFATPYFVLFDSPFISASALSPDGKWYAVPAGYQGRGMGIDSSFVVEKLQVFSTGIDRKAYEIPWEYYTEGISAIYALFPIRWLDTTQLIYESGSMYGGSETFIINPFSGKSAKWSGKINIFERFVSPDYTRTLQADFSSGIQATLNLYDLSTDEVIVPLDKIARGADLLVWSPDSSKFTTTAYHRIDLNKPSSWKLEIVDRAGQLLDVMMTSSGEVWPQAYSFSDDGNYLAVIVGRKLYLGDIQKDIVFDLCLTTGNMAAWENRVLTWSPYGNQLAFRYHDNAPVILDVENGEFYRFSSVNGDVVAWGQK